MEQIVNRKISKCISHYIARHLVKNNLHLSIFQSRFTSVTMSAFDYKVEVTSPSPNFHQVTSDIAIDGGVTDEGLSYLAEHFQSILYICTDDSVPGSSDFG